MTPLIVSVRHRAPALVCHVRPRFAYRAPHPHLWLPRRPGIIPGLIPNIIPPLAAAFPVIETTAVSTNGPTQTHTTTLPTGIISGNLLLAVVGIDNTENITNWSSGATWTQIFEHDAGSPSPILAAAYRAATGTDTLTFTTQFSQDSAIATYRISGAEDPTTQAPEASTIASGNSTSPDPGNLTPTGGAKDYLWIAAHSHDAGGTTNGIPDDYGNQVSTQGGGTGGVGVGCADRALNATSENPGTFTIAAEQWVAATIAVHPAAVASLAINLVMAPYTPT